MSVNRFWLMTDCHWICGMFVPDSWMRPVKGSSLDGCRLLRYFTVLM